MSQFGLKRVVNGLVPAVLVAVATSGCLSFPERQDFGEAVQHMQATQLARPGMHPAPQDGERARLVLEAYRQDVTRPQEIQNEVVINVGTGG